MQVRWLSEYKSTFRKKMHERSNVHRRPYRPWRVDWAPEQLKLSHIHRKNYLTEQHVKKSSNFKKAKLVFPTIAPTEN